MGINGAGRIGRALVRAIMIGDGSGRPTPYTPAFAKWLEDLPVKLKIAALNVSEGRDAEDIRLGIYRDSTFGFFHEKVKVWADETNGEKAGKYLMELGSGNDQELVRVYSTREVPDWSEENVQVLVETTGKNLSRTKLQPHLDAGNDGMRVIISAPPKQKAKVGEPPEKPIPMFVDRMNENPIPNDDNVISSASCTTTATVPMVKFLDGKFGVRGAILKTTHALTNSQTPLDIISKITSKDGAGVRSCLNAIPATTGAAKAMGQILTHLKGKLDGTATRIALSAGSSSHLTLVLAKGGVKADDINQLMEEVSKMPEYAGVIKIAEKHPSSADVVGAPINSLFIPEMTKAIPIDGDNTLVSVECLYDNEAGYTFANLIRNTYTMAKQIVGIRKPEVVGVAKPGIIA